MEKFAKNPKHPSLHTEKIDKDNNIWTIRASDSLRISFNWKGSEVTFRVVGEHEDVYENP